MFDPPIFPCSDKPLPSLAYSYIVLTVTTFIMGVYIALKWNSVEVGNDKEREGKIASVETVRTEEVSNTRWIFYFVFLSLRSLLATLKYSLIKKNSIFDLFADVGDLIFCGIAVLFLTLSLQHQYMYRSLQETSQSHINAEQCSKDNLPAPTHSFRTDLKRVFFGPQIIFYVFCVAYLLSISSVVGCVVVI
eukprot:TRINITY_DN3480_c0_g1_i8.p1 TRINITY_DN3480_c0_g1~~TRINITY_DN3480_c0_g1_i8.p1  ORF type:complete len:206 (+),score=21.70 TRINITY_DN3480_c0_g1_i8:46-618(+)